MDTPRNSDKGAFQSTKVRTVTFPRRCAGCALYVSSVNPPRRRRQSYFCDIIFYVNPPSHRRYWPAVLPVTSNLKLRAVTLLTVLQAAGFPQLGQRPFEIQLFVPSYTSSPTNAHRRQLMLARACMAHWRIGAWLKRKCLFSSVISHATTVPRARFQ